LHVRPRPSRIAPWLVAPLLALCIACGEDEGKSDAAEGDLSADTQTDDVAEPSDTTPDVATDTGIIPDVGTDSLDEVIENDLGAPDAGDVGIDATGLPCGGACAWDESCYAGICVRECQEGQDVPTLASFLAPGTEVVANFCTDTASTYAYSVLPSWEAVELRAQTNEGVTELELRRWPLYLVEGPGQAESIGFESVSGALATWEVLPAPFVATSQDHVLWGYATSSPELGGKVLRTSLSNPGSVDAFPAKGIAGGELLAGDRLLTHSFGFAGPESGPGIYYSYLPQETVVQVVTDLGSTTGDLVGVGDFLLISGYSDAWEPCEPPPEGEEAPPAVGGARVFAIPLGEINAAFEGGGPISARCGATILDLDPGFTGLGDGWILTPETDGAFELVGLSLRRLSVDPELGLTGLGDKITLSQGSAFIGGRKMPGAEIILLEHEAGYLLVKASFLKVDEGDKEEGEP
jgi:hypothetical protein